MNLDSQSSNSFYVNGQFTGCTGNTVIDVTNPANGEILVQIPCCSEQDVERAVSAARAAAPHWATTPIEQRVDLIKKLAEAFSANGQDFASLITSQMGSPISFSRTAQIGLPSRTFDIMINLAESLEDEKIGRSIVTREPMGVVAAITPWNFPLHQIAAKIVPALVAGCTIVLKPSEVTPLDAILFTKLIDECGFPAGVFNLVLGAAETGQHLVSNPDIDMVSFTGSAGAGRSIAAVAGGNLTKVSLELGGSSANIILDDADLEQALPAALGQCLVNTGQVCAALSRVLVPSNKLGEIEDLVSSLLTGWSPADPALEDTRMGPLSSITQRSRVSTMVQKALEDGARIVATTDGPDIKDNSTAFFAPIILGDVSNDMEIAQEEVFGPVLKLISYDNEEEAISLANASKYGLSGGVWSADLEHAERVARKVRSGQVMLNGAMFDLDAPFGGFGKSGIGRENGRYGLEEFFALKAITYP